MNVETLLQQYAQGDRDFSNAELGFADLTRANLSSANFAGVNLEQANLDRANIATNYQPLTTNKTESVSENERRILLRSCQ